MYNISTQFALYSWQCTLYSCLYCGYLHLIYTPDSGQCPIWSWCISVRVNAAVDPHFILFTDFFSLCTLILFSEILCNVKNIIFYCRKGIQLAHVGNCTALDENEFCPDSCPEDEDTPVCGSDGNSYR